MRAVVVAGWLVLRRRSGPRCGTGGPCRRGHRTERAGCSSRIGRVRFRGNDSQRSRASEPPFGAIFGGGGRGGVPTPNSGTRDRDSRRRRRVRCRSIPSPGGVVTAAAAGALAVVDARAVPLRFLRLADAQPEGRVGPIGMEVVEDHPQGDGQDRPRDLQREVRPPEEAAAEDDRQRSPRRVDGARDRLQGRRQRRRQGHADPHRHLQVPDQDADQHPDGGSRQHAPGLRGRAGRHGEDQHHAGSEGSHQQRRPDGIILPRPAGVSVQDVPDDLDVRGVGVIERIVDVVLAVGIRRRCGEVHVEDTDEVDREKGPDEGEDGLLPAKRLRTLLAAPLVLSKVRAKDPEEQARVYAATVTL
mmetsp:Transcript_2434/g.6562  ORF Transcript_2434/g.6562 Transcript_2434/m.6562 type:complete len:359 (-) Transcript_2434:596-1672(-)